MLSAVTLVPIYARDKLGEGPAAGEYAHVTATVTLGHDPLPSCGGGDMGQGGQGGQGGDPGTGGAGGAL